MSKKTLVLCNFPRFNTEIWIPAFWASAKTYYEKYGKKKDDWEWYPAYLDAHDINDLDIIKERLEEARPDIFAMSLYVWNYQLSHKIAVWVKERWPNCIVITGGPHQYIKHDLDWFKKYPHIDASVVGDTYGEIPIKEILDNYNDGKIDWKSITDVKYPSKSRLLVSSPKLLSREDKKHFDYNWSAYTEQANHIKDFVRYQRTYTPESMLMAILETTRGCPYGCTYCDWGGGIATTIAKKDIECVKKDINSITEYDLTYLYLADANFGIFGDRDIEVMKHIIKRKNETANTLKVGYGGFAKTENRLDTIRKIVELDFDNNCSHQKEVKFSVQTLDDEVLKNIDRKNIPLTKQIEVFAPIAKNNRIPMHAEIIMGLPGMTLDKFYHELNVFGSYRLAVLFYEWILLPEAPSYGKDYRDEWGIKTIVKTGGWNVKNSEYQSEIVVGGKTFSTDDYLKMILATSLYKLLIQGGVYSNTMLYITKTSIGYGDVIRKIIDEFVDNDLKEKIHLEWEEILENPDKAAFIHIGDSDYPASFYFVVKCFLDPDYMDDMMSWVSQQYNSPKELFNIDKKKFININNNNSKSWNLLTRRDYFAGDNITAIIGKFQTFINTGHLLTAKDKLLGILGN